MDSSFLFSNMFAYSAAVLCQVLTMYSLWLMPLAWPLYSGYGWLFHVYVHNAEIEGIEVWGCKLLCVACTQSTPVRSAHGHNLGGRSAGKFSLLVTPYHVH